MHLPVDLTSASLGRLRFLSAGHQSHMIAKSENFGAFSRQTAANAWMKAKTMKHISIESGNFDGISFVVGNRSQS